MRHYLYVLSLELVILFFPSDLFFSFTFFFIYPSSFLFACDGCDWIRWLQSINGYEHLFTEKNKSLESSVSCIVDTEDASVRENAVKLLMSAGGVAGHFRETVWRKCVELLDQINLERFFFC